MVENIQFGCLDLTGGRSFCGLLGITDVQFTPQWLNHTDLSNAHCNFGSFVHWLVSSVWMQDGSVLSWVKPYPAKMHQRKTPIIVHYCCTHIIHVSGYIYWYDAKIGTSVHWWSYHRSTTVIGILESGNTFLH